MKTDARWIARRRSSRAVAVALATCGALMTAALPSGAAGVDARTTLFVTNRDSSNVTMIDTSSDRIVGRIALGERVNPHMAMVTPDGKRLLVAGTRRNQALIVDLATLEIARRIPIGIDPEHFDISDDGRLALMGNLEEGTVSVLDLVAGIEIKRMDGFSEPHGFAFLPGEKRPTYRASALTRWPPSPPPPWRRSRSREGSRWARVTCLPAPTRIAT